MKLLSTRTDGCFGVLRPFSPLILRWDFILPARRVRVSCPAIQHLYGGTLGASDIDFVNTNLLVWSLVQLKWYFGNV